VAAHYAKLQSSVKLVYSALA